MGRQSGIYLSCCPPASFKDLSLNPVERGALGGREAEGLFPELLVGPETFPSLC